MKKHHSDEQIEEMRKRLYERGAVANPNIRHELSDNKIDVSRDWVNTRTPVRQTNDLRSGVTAVSSTEAVAAPEPAPKRHYRSFVLIGSFLIFIFVAGVSSLYLYFGGNNISNQNILINVTGPSLIGGGEEVSLQIAVSNQNSVPIESATLIIKYPLGTRSIGDIPRNLFEERIPLGDIAPNESQNVPIKVAVFGEENAEKTIEATVEYRVDGSNGMFYKDAEPLAFRIGSSPVVLRIEHVKKVASGQLVEMTITAASNSPTPLEDLLITASYPNGFSFETSDPAPVYGQNVWRIDELLPEQSATIKLQGIVTGLTEENFRINFDAGPANPDNQFLVGATLADASADFIIERPFINVDIAINGDKDRSAIIAEAGVSTVVVNIKNTLEETVYDMVVEAVPGGNALTDDSVQSASGFYDSNTGTVRWEVSNNTTFDRVLPGETRSLKFDVVPGPNRTTASYDLVVNVYARRVAESSAQETLIGTVRAEAKYSSSVTIASQAGQNTSSFNDNGPIPPKVGDVTSYTLTLVAEAGVNDISNAVVETSLPLYVNWLDAYEAEGTVTYNSVSKKLQWAIGDISSGQRKELSFQVDLKPSVSQIGNDPVLLNTQKFKANDRFTGALLQDDAPAVTTELSTEMGYKNDNGVVTR